MNPVESVTDQRRVPRLEDLDHPVALRLGSRLESPEARLRDLAVNSLRFEVAGHSRPPGRNQVLPFEASVPDLHMVVRCQARVARTYERGTNGSTVQGVALQFVNLDPTTRGTIRALYPAGVTWPDGTG